MMFQLPYKIMVSVGKSCTPMYPIFLCYYYYYYYYYYYFQNYLSRTIKRPNCITERTYRLTFPFILHVHSS